MLIRTSSGSTSVGHLRHSPHGFSSLYKPDFTFQCGSLTFPVHSVLLSASSKFFTEFFLYIRGQKAPETISLDAVKCEALSAVSLSYYLDFVYTSGALPAFDTVSEEVQLLQLSDFFGNHSLTAQLSTHLAQQLSQLQDEDLLQVFWAASDLKLRRLVTDCLVLLLPQFGRCTADSTVVAAIDCMDATLSKMVLTQLALHSAPPAGSAVAAAPPGPAAAATATSGATQTGGSDTVPGIRTPGRQDSGDFAADAASMNNPSPLAVSDAFHAARALDLEQMKQQFVQVLEAKGWGK